MSNALKSFLGITELSSELQNLIIRFFILYSFVLLFSGLGNSFIILSYIEKFNFGIAGFLMAVTLLAQFLTDYPTGSLGDYIGQKSVISLSLFFFGLGYYIVSSTDGYYMYLIAAIMFGIGLGQMSGAFESYLDNNYQKLAINVDEDKKIYGFMYQRVTNIGAVSMGFSFVIGGLISNHFSRNFVFLINALLLVISIPFILIFLNDSKENSHEKITKKENYFYYLKGGFQFLFSSKKIFFLLIGLAVLNASVGIWGLLILFPFYNLYTGTDAGVGILRSSIFLVGAMLAIYSAKLNRKLKNSYLGIMQLLFLGSLFIAVIILINLLPGNNTFNLTGIILVFLLMVLVVNFIGPLTLALTQRVLLVNVPSEKRNSIYSLIPTLAMILQVPLLPIVGQVIEISGLTFGLIIILALAIIGSTFLFGFHHYDRKAVISQQKDVVVDGLPAETL